MTKGNDVTMDAIKYLESRLPPGIRGNTLVDGDTLAIAIGEFDAAQKRAGALAEENARLRDALAALVGPGAVGYRDWFPDDMGRDGCTYCDYEWETGQPERHAPDCPVAAARALLDVGA